MYSGMLADSHITHTQKKNAAKVEPQTPLVRRLFHWALLNYLCVIVVLYEFQCARFSSYYNNKQAIIIQLFPKLRFGELNIQEC